jgi:hypothetical protein
MSAEFLAQLSRDFSRESVLPEMPDGEDDSVLEVLQHVDTARLAAGVLAICD